MYSIGVQEALPTSVGVCQLSGTVRDSGAPWAQGGRLSLGSW